jgi:hypothetical protein
MTHQVTCHVPDEADQDRRIKAIGGRDWQHSVDEAIYYIETGKNVYWAYVLGQRAEIVIAERPNGRKYLKTTSDGKEPNGLLGLLRCR